MVRSLTSKLGRILMCAVGLMAAGAIVSACSSSAPPAASIDPAKVEGPVAVSTSTSTSTPVESTTRSTEVSVPLSAITDNGLPSKVGHGPVSATTVKSLMQYFENHVSQAFANGDADDLESYLAGTMLTGNKATINVLNAQSRRNIYKIDVTKVIINNNETDRVVFEMKGNMTVDYFENTSTNQPVADGMPGPSPVDFLVFLDFNPANHTWYWTGEQNYSTTTGST
jgi:hypothetical protein